MLTVNLDIATDIAFVGKKLEIELISPDSLDNGKLSGPPALDDSEAGYPNKPHMFWNLVSQVDCPQ